GRPKPAPIRLRHLELGVPTRSPGLTRYSGLPSVDHEDAADDLWASPAAMTPADPAVAVPPVAPSTPAATAAPFTTPAATAETDYGADAASEPAPDSSDAARETGDTGRRA